MTTNGTGMHYEIEARRHYFPTIVWYAESESEAQRAARILRQSYGLGSRRVTIRAI